jgi:hypothetical protein
MGVDYYAQSIIGVRIPDPRIRTKVRGCKHPENNTKFCAECGNLMFTESTEIHSLIEKLDNDSEKRKLSPRQQQLGLVWSIDQEEAYVGFFKGGSESSRSGDPDAVKVELPDINIQELKKALQEELKELYSEKNFGLWTILHCSY